MTTREADLVFSRFIIERDQVCQRCCTVRSGLTCSHYWNRWRAATRFDPENCVALCVKCHAFWEEEPNQEYDTFMMNRLGLERFEALAKRAETVGKIRVAVAAFEESVK